ncbi:MAG: hypothetical protein Q9228_003253 [Teloschistes exilis]
MARGGIGGGCCGLVDELWRWVGYQEYGIYVKIKDLSDLHQRPPSSADRSQTPKRVEIITTLSIPHAAEASRIWWKYESTKASL